MGHKNHTFYYITVALSIQESFILSCNMKFGLHADFLLKYAQIFLSDCLSTTSIQSWAAEP